MVMISERTSLKEGCSDTKEDVEVIRDVSLVLRDVNCALRFIKGRDEEEVLERRDDMFCSEKCVDEKALRDARKEDCSGERVDWETG